MAVSSTIIAAAALTATAVSGYQQYRAAGKAADAQREGQQISQAAQQNRDQQQRRQQLREQRVRRARILQSAENSGVGSSSSSIGSIGSLGTNIATNIGNISAGQLAAGGIGQTQQASINAQQQGQLWGAVGGASGSIFSASGGFGSLAQDNSGGKPVNGGWQSEVFTF